RVFKTRYPSIQSLSKACEFPDALFSISSLPLHHRPALFVKALRVPLSVPTFEIIYVFFLPLQLASNLLVQVRRFSERNGGPNQSVYDHFHFHGTQGPFRT